MRFMLVGDVKTQSQPSPSQVRKFFLELQELMVEYQIEKIDIGWQGPRIQQQPAMRANKKAMGDSDE